MFCFDTDIISATLRPRPPLHLLRHLARTPAADQCTTAITVGEIVYGAARIGRPGHADRMHELLNSLHSVLAFDESAAIVYGGLRADLERVGKGLDDPDLRIASIAISRDLTLVTSKVRHFERVPGLRIENWLEPD